jgi:hypothetical protein
MPIMMRQLLTILLCTVIAASATAEDAVTLTWKWTRGGVIKQRYQSQMIHQFSGAEKVGMDQTDQQQFDTTMNVKAVNDGTVALSLTIDNIRARTQMGRVGFGFDSAAPAEKDKGNPLAGSLRHLVGQSVDYELQLPETIKSSKATGEDAVKFSTLSREQVLFQRLARGFKKDPVKVGDTWKQTLPMPIPTVGGMQLDATFTFQEWTEYEGERCALIIFKGPLKLVKGADIAGGAKVDAATGAQSGKIWFSVKKGLPLRQLTDQNLHVQITLPGDQKATSKIALSSQVRLLSSQ